MPIVELDYEKIAKVASATSPSLRDRLDDKNIKVVDPSDTGEGGVASIVEGVRPINQLDLSMPWDGNFNNYLNNCGPSCVSMVLMHATGKRAWPDEIADWMQGENHKGYTYVEDQARYLSAHGVPTVAKQASSLAEFQSLLRGQIDNGRLAIILVYWDFDANKGGHFEVVTAVDEPGMDVGCINPWKGTRPTFEWGYLWGNSLGGWVICPKKGRKTAPKPQPDQDASKGTTSAISEKLRWTYNVQPESWSAFTKIEVNVRSGPGSQFDILRTIPEDKSVKLTYYTDKGESVPESDPDTRWHYSPGRRGWIFDGGLHRWKKV